MKNDVEKLKDFIKTNPPLDEKGEVKRWGVIDWEKNLDELLPNWKDLLKNPDVWKKIEGIKPRGDYDDLLRVILPFAPDNILIEYLKSNDDEERETASELLMKDNAKRLTSDFWKLLDKDTKIWIISKIINKIKDRHYSRFLQDLDILYHDPERFFEILGQKNIYFVYPYIIPLAILEAAFYEEVDITHPLWIKLKATTEQANDLFSIRKIEEYEQKLKEKFQRIIEKLKPLWQLIIPAKYPFVSKNVMFDPSLLMDPQKATKAFDFIREYSKEFNLFISRSFYNFLKEYGESNKWYMVTEFFGYEKEISHSQILGLIEKHRQYLTFFEVPTKKVYIEKYEYFYGNLSAELENNRELIEILFEEWIFLQEFSWIVANTKKVFEKFKDSGAVVVEFSNKAVDKIIRKTLKKREDEFINASDKLRALGKWIAVGSSSATTFLTPVAGALMAFGTGIFLLLDPDELLEIEEFN
jgi:hypothetical protein